MFIVVVRKWASHTAQLLKNPPGNAGEARNAGLIPGSGRSPGVGNGNPLQCFLPGGFQGQRSLAGDGLQDLQGSTQHGARAPKPRPRCTLLTPVSVLRGLDSFIFP